MKLSTLFVKVISILLYRFVVTIGGGVWATKRRLSTMPEGLMQRVLLDCFERRLLRYGSWIGHKAVIDGIPILPHSLLGVFISNGAAIGTGCVIYQQVTIGSNNIRGSSNFGSPTIGKNCLIGAGAKIIGNVNIGDNCRIGANCVVVKDMPAHSVAVAGPTRYIQKANLENPFLTD
ncbi:serine acetyltransferase [Oryzobacter telluris]|uniref:serine acetyltransferase n=1 Tax=Oryzobacter telluris TaxID=3149179 RepID=UPI00370D22BF